MSAIGGPGGVGGPKGPSGPDGPDGPEPLDQTERVDEADAPSELSGAHAASQATGARGASATSATTDIDRIAAELKAGRLTAHEALDQLVAEVADTDTLPAADRAELRDLMTDLLAHDPHLAALVGRLG